MSNEVISVKIFDQEYKIKLGNQDPEYIKKLANYVDKKINEFTESFPDIPFQKLIILVCLNISDEYFKARDKGEVTPEGKEDFQKMLGSIKDLLLN